MSPAVTRTVRGLIVGVCAFSAACEGSPFLDPQALAEPELVRKQILPDLAYRAWWNELQSCSGATADYNRLRFFEVVSPLSAGDSQFPCGRGFSCNGMWERPHDISLAPAFVNSRRLVKHEMLHDLLATVEHPPLFDACEASWDFTEF